MLDLFFRGNLTDEEIVFCDRRFKLPEDTKEDFVKRLIVEESDLTCYFDNELAFGAATDFDIDLLNTIRVQDVGYMRTVIQLRRAWITRRTDMALENILRGDRFNVAEVQLYELAFRVRFRELTGALWYNRQLLFYQLYTISGYRSLDAKTNRSLGTKSMMVDLKKIEIHESYQAMLQILNRIL